jgi:Holliday junction resolvase
MRPGGSKQKGSRVEREIAKRLTKAGIPSRRVVMSGAAARYDERLSGDVDIGVLPSGEALFTAEVKARKDGAGFKVLEGWIKGNDLLVLRRDRADPFVAMPWATFIDLMQCYYEENQPPSGIGEFA